jgi:hypothetical protein
MYAFVVRRGVLTRFTVRTFLVLFVFLREREREVERSTLRMNSFVLVSCCCGSDM